MTEMYKDLGEARGVSWATTQVDHRWIGLVVHACRTWPQYITEPFGHWSRNFEYDWILQNGDFHSGQYAMDAGGGATPLQYVLLGMGLSVMNVDKDTSPIWQVEVPQHALLEQDLSNLSLTDGYFDRVVCASVLEHTDDPAQCLRELWRVLKPGGRLLVTLDVANPPTEAIRLTEQQVAELIAPLGISLPPEPDDLLRKDLGGLTNLKVLCFYRDKVSTGQL